MVKLINRYTQTEMWVSKDRVEEYLAAGHVLAVESTECTEEKPKKKKK